MVCPRNAAALRTGAAGRRARLTGGCSGPHARRATDNLPVPAREAATSIGVTMIGRPISNLAMLLGIGLAATLLAGCGGAVPSAPSTTPAASRPTASPATTRTPSASLSAAPSASPGPTEDLGLKHVNATLEDKLPGVIGGVQLEKSSMPLSTYLASDPGGDKILYTPWVVKMGKSTDDIDLAVAVDLTQTENFFVQAIQVPGVDAATLADGFANVARQNKWPVSSKTVGPKSVFEIIDPAAAAAGGLSTAYVYANADVLYVVVTDDQDLLLEALFKLPPAPGS